jgi:membrane fusion protein (multidrug efflux system)
MIAMSNLSDLNNVKVNEAVAKAISAPGGGDLQRRRKRLFALLGGSVAIAGLGWGLWWEVAGSHYVSTDNAYTAAEFAVVTPAVGGIVKAVPVVDTQAVRKGDVLAEIDPVDARLGLQQADADLGRAIRHVRGYVANDQSLSAQIAAHEAARSRSVAAVAEAEAQYQRAAIDLKRRKALASSGSISAEELTNAENAFAVAGAALEAARAAVAEADAGRSAALGSRNVNAALIDGVDVDDNPEVALARARRDQAKVDLERTVIRAPFDGVVGRRSVQIGQRIQPGSQLMVVVPTAAMHVDANFKEVQLAKVVPGQPAKVVADLYGSDVVFHGRVEGFSGGTGSVFAAIPAQNATGNWIKVVQRLPIRIALDPKELAAHPLQMGLSTAVTIDTKGASEP